MTIDIEELKRLAEPLAAPNGADSNASWWDSFHRAANPATVLELIAEIERLRESRDELLGALKALDSALDSCCELTPDVMRRASTAIANAEKTK